MKQNKQQTMLALEKFIEVVEELRSDHGCPWDKAQTHDSLRMQLIEEAYEAADAMHQYEKTGEYENLREELGDVLLHVVMHSVIAQEEGIFTLQEVTEEITEKMIHRHPHVFHQEEWKQQEHKKTWEELKAEEKGHDKTKVLPLRQIPKHLPALLKAAKVQKKADSNYGRKIEEKISLEQISLLGQQLEKASSAKEKEKIMTAMLYHMTNVAWQEKINLEQGLMDKTQIMIEALERE